MAENNQNIVSDEKEKEDIMEQPSKNFLSHYLEPIANEPIFAGFGENKIPINAKNKEYANVSDPNTWVTYEEAHRAFCNDPNIIGIGVMLGKLSNGNTLCAFDIDSCVNENGEISEKALSIIEKVLGYTEYSKSGRGIHILFQVTGDIDFPIKNRMNVSKTGYTNANTSDWCKELEFYYKSRFIALTGKGEE